MPRLSALRGSRPMVMFALIIAGESVFVLPFVVARVFRTTFLEVFRLSNLQLGSAFSIYGLVAMASYFFGGPLADRFSAPRLIGIALAATALGGLVFATIPPVEVLAGLYGFWGLTSILLFWAALIRATRAWGGADSQGRAYGILDGGRGLMAAVLASLMVALFEHLLPLDVESVTPAQRTAALSDIILICSGFTLSAAVLALLVLPGPTREASHADHVSLAGVRQVAHLPGVWLQAVIIVCAYVAYKVTDNFGLYAHDVLGYNEVEAARIGTLGFWVRPVAALGAGLLADRVRASRAMIAGFLILALGAAVLGLDLLPLTRVWVYAATVVTASVGIYGIRGVYFSVMGEAGVPMAATGSAVGLVSFIGYTPDVFSGPLVGYLLDRDPGAGGHQHVFLMVGGFALVGLAASVALWRLGSRAPR